MEILKELVHVITKNKVRSIEVIGNSNNKKSKVVAFYEGIHNGQFTTDEEASQHFYNSGPNNPNYKKLKAKLKERLTNTVFFIDVKLPSFNEHQRAYYTCCKDWASIKILIGRSARKPAINLAHKTLKQALRFEYYDLAFDIVALLRVHYGMVLGNLKEFDKYDKLVKEYESIYFAETRAEGRYAHLITHYVDAKSKKVDISKMAQGYYEELEPLLEKITSYKFHLFSNMINLIRYMSQHDYLNTIKICKKAVAFFESKEFVYKSAMSTFLHQQLVCHTQLKQYDEGVAIAQRCFEIIAPDTPNWYKNMELYFMLSMHTGKYQKGYDIYKEAVSQKRFKFLSSSFHEIWNVYKFYLYYLATLEKIKPSLSDKEFTKFRLGKFLNEVPTFSKDKRGMNIPILIAQILFMILHRKYDDAVERIEAIEKYCSRYLLKDNTFRSNCFIKMLLQIPISGFHRAGVQRRSSKFLQKLETVPLDVASQSHEIEIIPYDILWNMVLDSLSNSFVKLRRR